MRDMWRDHFATINPEATPLQVTRLPDGRVVVRISYVVRPLDGRLFTEEAATNTFTFADDLIIAMEWA